MNLSTKSITDAIGQIELYKAELKIRTNRLIERLTERGVEIAKLQVRQLDAVYTGQLEESIEGVFDPENAVGIIRAGAPYAVYVEYGTGIVGQNFPHPAPEGWQYDVNKHGESGWWYFNDRDGRWHWTQGMVSRPFMYNTARELERQAITIAREVFAS